MNRYVLAVLAVAITAFYFFWNPTEISFLPKCQFKQLTGFYCPGCGGQRAFHEVLHGEFVKAIHNNIFIFIVLPFILLKLIGFFRDSVTTEKLVLTSTQTIYFIIAIMIFTIVRNLPFYPFKPI